MTSPNSIPLHQHPIYLQLYKCFQQTKTHLSITDRNFGHPLIEKASHIFPIFLQRTSTKLRSIHPKLKRLSLDLDLLRNQRLPLYNHLLKGLKDLEHFKVTLYPDDRYQYFDTLLKTLKKARNLQVFEVIIPIHFRRLGNKMRSLIKTLSQSAPRLTCMKVIFEGGSGGSLAQGTRRLLLDDWKIQRLATLQSLTLHLPKAAFVTLDAENEEKFDLSALKRFRRLKSLGLAVGKLSAQPRSHRKKIAFEPPKTRLSPNLRRFQWGILDSHWADIEGLHLLGSELASYFQIPLENYTLKIKQSLERSRTINDDVIKTLNQSFATLKTDLNQLHLTCVAEGVNSKSSDAFILALAGPRLRRMQILCLGFRGWKGINDGFLGKFSQVISQNMDELKYLKLHFAINQERSNGFAGVLKRIFGKGEDEGVITDQGISKFGASLAQRCGNLEFVWLVFWDYEKISDQGVDGLCENLSRIKGLKRVWLSFRSCGVSEMGGEYAREKLGEQREVQFSLM